jgi:hypothetical protein
MSEVLYKAPFCGYSPLGLDLPFSIFRDKHSVNPSSEQLHLSFDETVYNGAFDPSGSQIWDNE